MHSFKDAAGREWKIAFSMAQAKKLKDHPQLKLDVLDGGESLTRLATSPYDVANALYLLCEKQATEEGVTDEQFGELLAGNVIDEATQALLDELVDFFPKRQREALRTMLAKMESAQTQAAAIGIQKLNSPAAEAMIAREMDAMSKELDSLLAGKLSGSVQEQLAGTGAA